MAYRSSNVVSLATIALLVSVWCVSACSAGSNTPSKSDEPVNNGGSGNGGVPGSGGVPTSSGGDPGTAGSAGVPAELPAFDAGTDSNRNAVAPGAVCDRIATIQCAGEQHCCASPGRTFDQCKSTMKTGCVNSYLDTITANTPYSGYRTEAAEPIFQHFEELASACDPSVTAWGASAEGLRGIVPGTAASGEKCTPSALELQQASVVAAHLSSCRTDSGTACLPHPATIPVTEWLCAPVAAAGGGCFTDVNCEDGLYCDNPKLDLAGGKCTSRKSDGSACSAGNECGSLLCKGGACASLDVQHAYCLAN